MQETGSWSNAADLEDMRGQELNRNKKKQYLNQNCGRRSPVCLILSLLALILLGTGIAAMLVFLIAIPKTTTSTSTTSTTSTSTTSTTSTSTTSTSTSTTSTTSTSTTSTTSTSTSTTSTSTTSTTSTSTSTSTSTTSTSTSTTSTSTTSTSTTSTSTTSTTSTSTTSTTTTALPPQCSSYVSNTDATRSVTYGSSSITCDSASTFGSSPAWVRFSGSAGTLLASYATASYNCGTQAPGWYTGSNPAVGSTTTGLVCYSWSGNTCSWSNFIMVTNCNGFYIYQLTTPPLCNLRYCTM